MTRCASVTYENVGYIELVMGQLNDVHLTPKQIAAELVWKATAPPFGFATFNDEKRGHSTSE